MLHSIFICNALWNIFNDKVTAAISVMCKFQIIVLLRYIMLGIGCYCLYLAVAVDIGLHNGNLLIKL